MRPIVTMIPASENGGEAVVILRVERKEKSGVYTRKVMTPEEARSLAEALRIAAEKAEK